MKLRIAVKRMKAFARKTGPCRADACYRIFSSGLDRRIRTWRAMNRINGLSRMTVDDIAKALATPVGSDVRTVR